MILARHNPYNNAEWRKLRADQLREHPECRRCAQVGRYTRATVADHIKPHKGDHELFIDPDNLQSLCATCHNSYKRRLEVSGKVKGCDVYGLPLDPKHNWRNQA